jgi:uncharacterized protein YoxC
MPPLALSPGDFAQVALGVFLLLAAVAMLLLAWAFFWVGGTMARLSAFIKGAQGEILPVIAKVGGTVEGVNQQLGKVDQMTDSAVDAVESVDTAIRAVSFAIQRPVQKVSGLAAGITHGAAALKARRDWRSAVEAGKEAAVRRENELAEELRLTDEGRE